MLLVLPEPRIEPVLQQIRFLQVAKSYLEGRGEFLFFATSDVTVLYSMTTA